MRNVKKLSFCLLMLALVSTAAVADTHYVNLGDSIQAAINAAVSGDEIEVAPGTYTEAIIFNGKAIRLYSAEGRDATTINATGLGSSVVTCKNSEGADTMLEGFTVTGGGGPPLHNGGGMFNTGSSPTVTNCIFASNNAYRGGGMLNDNNSRPTVTNCIFASNTGTYGGGMYNAYGSNSTVTNCTFENNNAPWFGGGMDNKSSDPTVTNCTFSGNLSPYGGGMFNEASGDPTVTNCTFTRNTSTHGGGMYSKVNSSPTVTNCIFWGDTVNEIVNEPASITTVTYSDVQLGYAGTGNINADPMFTDALNGDYRLLSGSLCIDAGNDAAVPSGVTTDLDGNPRIQGLCVDMGAFEVLADPMVMLTQLKAYIQQQVALGIDAEMEVSLLAKVDAAIAALNRGNANDAKVAMNDLKALVNQVEAQAGNKITAEAAAAIIDRANAVIVALGG